MGGGIAFLMQRDFVVTPQLALRNRRWRLGVAHIAVPVERANGAMRRLVSGFGCGAIRGKGEPVTVPSALIHAGANVAPGAPPCIAVMDAIFEWWPAERPAIGSDAGMGRGMIGLRSDGFARSGAKHDHPSFR